MIGKVQLGSKVYEIKRRVFTLYLSSGEKLPVGGEFVLLLGRVATEGWKSRPDVDRLYLALSLGLVDCVSGKLSLTEKGREVLEKFSVAQEREDARQRDRRKKARKLKRALLKSIKSGSLSVEDLEVKERYGDYWFSFKFGSFSHLEMSVYLIRFPHTQFTKVSSFLLFSRVPQVDHLSTTVRLQSVLGLELRKFLVDDDYVKTLALYDDKVRELRLTLKSFI